VERKARKLTVEFVLDPDEPVTHQIADHVMKMVALGIYRPGDDLPSAAALSKQLGISRKIAQAAYTLLEERNVTSGVRGGSTSIAQVADTRRHYARRVFSDAITMLRNLIPPLKQDELEDAYRREADRHFASRRKPAEDDSDN
jgi:DNA-binding transcriptional regulator YhcF (GntR family)